MNKLIIFDLDGVLLNSRELHYETLNRSLNEVGEQFVISREEHLSTFDGLNTTRKLQLLTRLKGLPETMYDAVWQNKQKYTVEALKQLDVSGKLITICQNLKEQNYQIAVASNSIRETVKICLIKLGIMEYIDYFVSNQDVERAKPFPEMYWKCMTKLNALPKNTIIIEDSHIGREGALNSGAHLLPVEDANTVTLELINNKIKEVEMTETTNIPWRDSKLNVLIPMAGAGSRFAQQGYTFPKPLIDVEGKPMIQVVIENLNIEANYIYLVQKDHYEKYNLKHLLNLITPNCTIVQVDGVTDGAARTTLLAKEYIDNDAPLVMANSDQYVEWNSNECMYAFTADSIDGGIITFEATHPKWSFAKLNDDGFVAEVAEKRPISNMATVGIYYWKRGSDYVKYAEQMIDKDIRTNNEFYVAPVFNEAIADGKKIRAKNIEKMWGIGTPEDLNYFLDHRKEK